MGNPRFRYVYRGICSIIITVIAVLMYLTIWISFAFTFNTTGYLYRWGNLILVTVIYSIIFLVNGKLLNTFKTGVERQSKQIASVIITSLLTNVIMIPVSLAIINNYMFVFALTWRYLFLSLCQSSVLALTVTLMVSLYRNLISPLPVVMIYGDHISNLDYKMNAIPQKYNVDRVVKYDDPDINLDDLIDNSASILVNDVPAEVEGMIIKKCFEKDKRIYVVPKIADILLKASDSISVFDTPLYLSRNLGMSFRQRFVKRSMDIVLCGLAVVILSPVFLITAIAIKLEDKGPVFYRQERVTKDGKHFMMLKFRSMIVDAEKDGCPRPAGKDDDRITRVGRVIRACRIDELPQLFNILSGEMSIVGPRPERFEHVEMYTSEIPEFKLREKVKGGLTGYAQVYGKYNTTPLDKLKMDLMYITNYSVLLDIQIMFETLKILFQKESTEGFDEESIRKLHDSH